jgi:hypothetical protein
VILGGGEHVLQVAVEVRRIPEESDSTKEKN